MARFNFRIGTKLGLSGHRVVLVAGVLLGNQSIALSSR
jgi:hypothetical protein